MKQKSSILGTFDGKSCDSNVFNNNEMHLGRELFEKILASQEYKDAIERGHYIGFLGHPEDPGCQDFKSACIVMTKMSIDDDGTVHASFNLIDTPVGRIVKAFIDAGVKFGISIRGAGDVSGSGEVDPDTFCFRGFDLVAFPAYNDCIPTFQQIAASSDLDAQKKYKKVCAVVKANLAAVTASNTLDIIQEQFRPDTDEYNMVEEQRTALVAEPELSTNADDVNVDVLEAKVSGMTQLYLEQLHRANALEAELNQLKAKSVIDLQDVQVECSKKIDRVRTIMSSEFESLNSQLNDYVTANTSLKRQLSKMRSEHDNHIQNANLKYRQKIESATSITKQKDLEIAELQSKLNETVMSSKEVSQRLSNLDKENREMKAKVEAADNIILSYQQAYATIYANALGVRVEDVPITASTTVEQLQKLITSNSVTSNNQMAEIYSEDVVVDDEYDADLVTM